MNETVPPVNVDERVSALPLRFPIVGIGASAGGWAAISTLFECMPSKTGMAFVIVLHLSSEHESNAAPILQQRTKMKVHQVTETVAIEPDHVYVIAPGLQLEMFDGQLVVRALERPGGRQVAIDTFFRTLAHAHRERAIAVVLSGAGSDGSIGLRDIKGEGGVAIAQTPSDAEYDAMPSAAIASAYVDFILPAAEIAAKLVDLWLHAQRITLPDADASGTAMATPTAPDAVPRAEAALRDVMAMLLARTGHDFRGYKRATVLRRIERRLQVTQQADLPAYLEYLKANQQETSPLLQDLLITVTRFFRDPEAFEAVERVIVSSILDRLQAGAQVRAWSVGCATGEEAYSLGMLLNDHLPRNEPPVRIQVFASDVDSQALGIARAGLYPDAIINDISGLRFRKYFEKHGRAYRVKRMLREQVLFAPHNVLSDPPFSKIDVISCRNLLIYMERQAQTEVLTLLHFALNPGGLLFLGTAESADWLPELFTAVDKNCRVYRANSGARRRDLVPLRTMTPHLLATPIVPVAATPPPDYRGSA